MASGFAVAPQQQQEQPQGQAAPQGAQPDALAEWRQLAQAVQELTKKYPEAAPASVEILKAIQKSMTLIAANPQRTPQQQAPPNG